MLRRVSTLCFFVALFGLLSASRVKADDLFTYTLGSNTFTWDLPGSPTLTSADVTPGNSFFISGVQYWENGALQGTGTFDFYNGNPSVGGGFDLMVGSSGPLNEYGVQLYSGSEGTPTFLLGTFTLNHLSPDGPAGTLTIASITAVPEPSGLLLIGTGALGLIGFARKKIFA